MVTIDELMALGMNTVASTFAADAARAHQELGNEAEVERWAEFAIAESTEDDFASGVQERRSSPAYARVAVSTARPNGWPAKQLPSSIKRTTWSSWPTLTPTWPRCCSVRGKHAEAVTEFQASRDTYRRKGHLKLANVELETAWRKSPMNNPAALPAPHAAPTILNTPASAGPAELRLRQMPLRSPRRARR